MDRAGFLKRMGLLAGLMFVDPARLLQPEPEGVPAYTFSNDMDTGMYRVNAQDLKFVMDGKVLDLNTTGNMSEEAIAMYRGGNFSFTGEFTGVEALPTFSGIPYA